MADSTTGVGRGFRAFWPFYLAEHSRRGTVALHAVGTLLALGVAAVAVWTAIWWLLLVALASGYLFAWVGHFAVERNRPATFRYPLRSFAGDWVMLACLLSGQLGKQMRRHGVWPERS